MSGGDQGRCLLTLLTSSTRNGYKINLYQRHLSVRKVVLTLTSTSAEIYLSMAGAKQHDDTDFIMVPAVGRTSSRGVLVTLYCIAP
jgi:hypothetical protein